MPMVRQNLCPRTFRLVCFCSEGGRARGVGFPKSAHIQTTACVLWCRNFQSPPFQKWLEGEIRFSLGFPKFSLCRRPTKKKTTEILLLKFRFPRLRSRCSLALLVSNDCVEQHVLMLHCFMPEKSTWTFSPRAFTTRESFHISLLVFVRRALF